MGSTIDNSQVSTQLEYRQHIWRRFGFVAWGGGATLFSDFDEFIDRDIKPKWLYNFGFGLRFEFKHNVNIRIDYGFGENTLYVWLFKDVNGISILYNYFYIESTRENTRKIFYSPTLLDDPNLCNTSVEERHKLYEIISNLLISYLAVKKYAKVETIIVPSTTIKIVEDTINDQKHKEKVKNDSGQEVRIMDSRWFVKIINELT